MAKSVIGDAAEMGCLGLRLVAAVVFLVLGLAAVAVVVPLLLLIFLAIPFMFL